jgi:tripartite-type tricarboxylate transporter receptor subunit TctC
MNRMAETDVLHIPYRGSAPAVTDVATGAVTMSFSSLGAALPLMQAGQIRAVAVTSKERMPQLPDVPPLRDGPGLSGYELLNWFAMFAPASTPEPILARLSELVPNILKDPAIAAKLEVQGIVARPMTSTQLRAFVRSESEKFGKIIEVANIKLEN